MPSDRFGQTAPSGYVPPAGSVPAPAPVPVAGQFRTYLHTVRVGEPGRRLKFGFYPNEILIDVPANAQPGVQQPFEVTPEHYAILEANPMGIIQPR